MTAEGYCPRCLVVRVLAAPDCGVCNAALSRLADDWPEPFWNVTMAHGLWTAKGWRPWGCR